MFKSELFNELSKDEKADLFEAIWNFATALTNLQEFKEFEEKYMVLKQDPLAQEELIRFKQKQQEINKNFRKDGNREDAQKSLNEIHSSLMNNATISEYLAAEEKLMSICTKTGEMLSKRVNMDYATVCGPSCCG